MNKNVAPIASLVVMTLTIGVISSASAQEFSHSFRTTNFEVKHQPGISETDARKTSDYLEQDYSYIRKTVGIDLEARPEVRIYESDQKFAKATGERNSSRGALSKRGIMHVKPVAKLESENRFAQVLSYELAVLVLDHAVQRGCPQWLVQSFGVYHSGKMVDLTPPTGRTVRYFSDLDQDIQEYPDPPRRQEVEYLLGTTMKFLVEKLGEEKAFSIFMKFDGTATVEEVFSSLSGQEYASIEKEWSSFIVREVGEFPADGKKDK